MKNNLTVVAGGNSGIGYEIARTFFADGSDVVILGRNKNKNEKAIKSIAESVSSDSSIKSYVCDMSIEKDIKKVFNRLKKNYGGINNLINSVGLWKLCPIKKLKYEFIIDMHKNNLLPIILSCKIAPDYMKKNSSIVNVSSFAAIMPMPDGSIYSAYKAAVINFTKSCADEFASENIRVNCVTPGVIETPMTAKHISGNRKKLQAAISLKSIGTPDMVAQPVKFLCAHESNYITGENLVISGGKYIVQK